MQATNAVVKVVVKGFCSVLKLHHDLAKLLSESPQRLHCNWNDLNFVDCQVGLAGYEYLQMQATNAVDEVVLTRFCSLLKMDKVHHDLATLPLILPQRWHWNWNDLNFASLPSRLAGF